MSAYTTLFNSPIKVGNSLASDNLQLTGIGDVVLSQNLAIGNALNATGFIILPIGADLLDIAITSVNGATPAAGVIAIIVSQADGSGTAVGPTVTFSAASGFNTPVVFNGAIANVYQQTVPLRLAFNTTTAITGGPQLIAETRYAIRG